MPVAFQGRLWDARRQAVAAGDSDPLGRRALGLELVAQAAQRLAPAAGLPHRAGAQQLEAAVEVAGLVQWLTRTAVRRPGDSVSTQTVWLGIRLPRPPWPS